LPKTEDTFTDLMKNVNFTRVFQIAVPILQPVIIGGLWLLASRFDKRADALSKLIAIAEPIPTVDLNIPKPVVLASLYHSVDELADVLGDVLKFLQNLEVPSAEDIVDKVKEELLPEPLDVTKALTDFKQCLKNYEESWWIPKNNLTKALYIEQCLIRKGYAQKSIKEWLRVKLS